MKPWHKMQSNLEIYLEKILNLKDTDKDIEDLGVYLVTNIAICKDIGNINDEAKQAEMWNSVSNDYDEMIKDITAFMKERRFY